MMMVISVNTNHNPDRHQSLLREALASSSIGWEIGLPIVGGALLGQVLDQWIGTKFIFTLFLLFFGVLSGAYNLIRAVQRINAQKTTTRGKPISDEEWDAWDEEWQEYDWYDEEDQTDDDGEML